MHGRALTRLLVLAALALPAATAAAQDAAPVEPSPRWSWPRWTPAASGAADAAPPEPGQPTPEGAPGSAPASAPETSAAPPPATTATTATPAPPPAVAPAPLGSSLASPAPNDAIFNEGATPNKRVAIVLHASVGADWFRQMPRMSLDEVSSERTVAAQKLPSVGALAMWRAQVGFDVVVSRRWVVPGLGMAVGAAVGPSDRVLTAADGSPVEMRPWTAGMITLTGPGAGIRLTQRRWTFAGNARFAANYVWMRASVVTGRTTNDETVRRWMPSVRVDLEACRRIGPRDQACLYVETRAYEGSPFNGGSAGLRWEFGG